MASRSRAAASLTRTARRLGVRRGTVRRLPAWRSRRQAAAQDSHYWSIQYGPVGQLVGGQLIGGGPTSRRPSTTRARSPCATSRRTSSPRSPSSGSPSPPRRQPGLDVLDISSSTLRRGAVAARRRPAALAGRGHAPRLVLPHAAEAPLRLGQRVTDPLPEPGVEAPPSPTSTSASPRAGRGSRLPSPVPIPWASG